MRIKSLHRKIPEKRGFPGHGGKSPVCGETPDDAPVEAESSPADPARDDAGTSRGVPFTP
jgi:hypothetical protein